MSYVSKVGEEDRGYIYFYIR